MNRRSVTAESLARLEPLSSLSDASRRQLAAVCVLDELDRGTEPLALVGPQASRLYLLAGELLLTYTDGSTEVVVGGTEGAGKDIGRRAMPVVAAKAITEIALLRVDEDLLDIFLTWDQLAGAAQGTAGDAPDWRTMSGIYAAQQLASGAFSNLPPAHIQLLLARFERVRVTRGDVVVRQGDGGDYYYVIESGRAAVERAVSGARLPLAELGPGDVFGEEALLADTTRNATVTMRSDGVLQRLGKRDFVELLREPLLRRVSMVQAQDLASRGGQWLDVRYPAEFLMDRMPGAINIPVNEIRNAAGSLDVSKEYIAYCQSGRRSSAAAFILSQRGYRAVVLEGGLRGARRGAD